MRPISSTLADALRSSPARARRIVEAVAVTANYDVKQTAAGWQEANSTSGFHILNDGTIQLADTVNTAVSSVTDDGSQTGLNPVGSDTLNLARVGWGSKDHVVTSIVAELNPDSGNVDTWVCQLYRLAEIIGDPDAADAGLVLAPISPKVRVDGGSSVGDFTFDFDGVEVGDAPINGGTTFLYPVTYIVIWGLESDESVSTAAAWSDLTGTSTGSPHVLAGQRLISVPSQPGVYNFQTTNDIPHVQVIEGAYSAATLTYDNTSATNVFDLGAVPTNDVELVAHIQAPGGTSFTAAIDDDVVGAAFGGSEIEGVDGDFIVATMGFGLQQTYAGRITLTPNAAGTRTPRLHRFGLQEVTIVNLDGLVTIEGGTHEIRDVISLAPVVPEVRITVVRDGIRDYEDAITTLLSENHIGNIQFRVWWGHPDIDRSEWMLDDIYLVDDYTVERESITVTAVSVLQELKGALPVVSGTSPNLTRTPFTQTNVAINTSWSNIITEAAPANRYIGEGPATATTITYTVTDSDALLEAGAVSALGGWATISSQGAIKAVDMFGPSGVVHLFDRSEIQWRSVTPGFARRVTTFYVRYNYDPDSGDYDNETEYRSASAITNLGTARIDAQSQLPEIMAEKIDTDALANTIGQRTIEAIGTGIVEWEFDTIYAFPEWEPGDIVAVPVEHFVARDPGTGRTIKGLQYAPLRLTRCGGDGQTFTGWLQSYADLVMASDTIGRELTVLRTIDVPLYVVKQTDGEVFDYSGAYLQTTETTTQSGNVPIQMPSHAVQIDAARARVWGANANGIAWARLFRQNDSGLTAVSAGLEDTQQTAWEDIEDTGLAEDVAGNNYIFVVQLSNGVGGSTGDFRIQGLQLDVWVRAWRNIFPPIVWF